MIPCARLLKLLVPHSRWWAPVAPRALHKQLNRKARSDEIILREGLRLSISPYSRNAFEHFCFRDDEMPRELDAFLALSRKKRRLLDVGAFHGIFSLSFTTGRPDAEALAVEPSPLAFERLTHNVRANDGCRVRSIPAALSDQQASLPMCYDWEHLNVLGSEAFVNATPIRAEALTGDMLCRNMGFEPDIVKIDVEGYEHRCLLGLMETLEHSRPAVCLEVHPALLERYGNEMNDLVTLFDRLSYSFCDLGGRRMDDHEVRSLDRIRRCIVLPSETSAAECLALGGTHRP